jgi:hypothetical protein
MFPTLPDVSTGSNSEKRPTFDVDVRLSPDPAELPKPPPTDLQPPSVSPVQFVGHVITPTELKAFPNSPIVNINLTSDARYSHDCNGYFSSDYILRASEYLHSCVHRILMLFVQMPYSRAIVQHSEYCMLIA